jgi:hypothetical protein
MQLHPLTAPTVTTTNIASDNIKSNNNAAAAPATKMT